MSASPSLYNPRDTNPERLNVLLTGRTALLEEILANLREQAGGRTRQHWLLRGQRGMGKTHLAGVIYYRVKTDPTLNRTYLPLWLGEADTFEVYSAATLLKTIGERFAEETKEPALLSRLNALEGVGDDEGYFQELAETLTAEAKQRGRVLLVLMENLDALLGSFGPKERKEQTRQLRSLLLHNPRFLFISTTPTRYLSSLDDPKEPLYAHLKERDLDHLTEPETEQLLHKLAELHPREGTEGFLDGKDGRLRLRVIYRLTGGLPRSIVMAFSAIREAVGLGSLVQELRAVLDVQTAYFEARLARLASRERAIVTAMALAPTNLKMKEIAQLSRLPERTLSTHMSRLEKDGHVRPVLRPGGKGAVYELSEGLFRLWYQYRKGRPVLEPLVEILVYWYPLEELRHVVDALRQGTEASGRTRVAELALLQAEEALRRASSKEGQQARQQLWAECQEALKREAEEAVSESMNELDQTARKVLDEILVLLEDREGLGQGDRLFVEKLLEERSRSAQSFPVFVRRVISSIMDRVEALGPEVALRALSSVRNAFPDNPSLLVQAAFSPARMLVAHALYIHSPLEALAESDAVLSLGPAVLKANKFIWTSVLFARGAALKALGRADEAIQELERFMAMADQGAGRLQVLDALTILAELYSVKKQLVQARALAEQIINRFGSIQEEPFRLRAAEARMMVMFAKLGALGDVPQTEVLEGIQALDQWLEDYAGLDSPDYWNARFLIKITKACTQALMGDLSAQGMVSECVQAAVEGKVTYPQPFFHTAINLFDIFGPEAMKEWLTALSRAPLSEETRLLVSWHRMAAEVLLAEESRNGKASSSPKELDEAWARIPPEIRPNVQELVRKVSESRASAGRGGEEEGSGTSQ